MSSGEQPLVAATASASSSRWRSGRSYRIRAMKPAMPGVLTLCSSRARHDAGAKVAARRMQHSGFARGLRHQPASKVQCRSRPAEEAAFHIHRMFTNNSGRLLSAVLRRLMFATPPWFTALWRCRINAASPPVRQRQQAIPAQRHTSNALPRRGQVSRCRRCLPAQTAVPQRAAGGMIDAARSVRRCEYRHAEQRRVWRVYCSAAQRST